IPPRPPALAPEACLHGSSPNSLQYLQPSHHYPWEPNPWYHLRLECSPRCPLEPPHRHLLHLQAQRA
ncbi:hypothetical protein GOODEAATRI_011354, partial [Goodea atripinnis]